MPDLDLPFEPGSDSAATLPCPWCARKFVKHESLRQHARDKHGEILPIVAYAVIVGSKVTAAGQHRDYWSVRQALGPFASSEGARQYARENVRLGDDDGPYGNRAGENFTFDVVTLLIPPKGEHLG